MAFVKRTWLARIGTGLNKFIIGDKDANNKQTLTNSPDTVTQQGDVISAENLNDLEDRIDNEFTADATLIASKADKTYVDTQLATKQNTLTFDDVPTSGSNNPVKSGGIYTALSGKQNTLTFDDVPTQNSNNPVKSGGIYTELEGKMGFGDLKLTTVGSTTSVPQTSQGDYSTTTLSYQIEAGYKVIGIQGFKLLILSGNRALNVSIVGVMTDNSSAAFTFVANESVPAGTGLAQLNLLLQKTS